MSPRIVKSIGNTTLGIYWIQVDMDDIKIQNDFRFNLYPITFIVIYVTTQRVSFGIKIFDYRISLEFSWYG